MKIKVNQKENSLIEFILPSGSIATVYEIDYDCVQTGDYADPSEYRYKSKNYDEFGYAIDEFNGKSIIEYANFGFKEYDENLLKFVKKLCLYYSKELCLDSYPDEFEMPDRYLELISN